MKNATKATRKKSRNATTRRSKKPALSKAPSRRTPKPRRRFAGKPLNTVPELFTHLCREAKEGRARGYAEAGLALACSMRQLLVLHHIGRILGGSAKSRSSASGGKTAVPELAELHEAVNAKDKRGILAWFRHYFRDCVKLIPPSKHEDFVQGVLETRKKSGIWKR